MFTKILLISILLLTSISFAQKPEKYFIYFTDKGIDRTHQLSKFSAEYNQAINSLSERSIKRRIKTLGENYITFEDLPLNKDYINKIKSSGAKIVWKLKWFNAVSVFLTDVQYQLISEFVFVDKIVKVKKLKYKKDIGEENRLSKTLSISDSKYNLDYGLSFTQYELSDIPIVHNYGISGKGVLIGILDAGFAWKEHIALQSRSVLAERDFVYGGDNTDDGDASHGTSVFSLIGGFDEGNIVAPAYSAQFVLAKTENILSETHLEEDNYAAAMEWMDSIGVDITTTSLGYSEFDEGEGDYTYADMDGKTTIVTQASELAFSRGILTINSAGNEGNSSWKYITAPADGFNTIAVGAVNYEGVLASFSSVGPTFDGRIKPEIVAQGVSCYHAKAYSNSYGSGSGTSFSGPIAAGIAAQLLSAFSYLSNEQVRKIIIEASDRTNYPNNRYGYGLLSSKVAVEFPNVSHNSQTDEFFLNKAIIDTNGILNDNLNLFYSVNSEEKVTKIIMNNISPNIYQSQVDANRDDIIKFYFEYADSNNVTKRFPELKNYQLTYGTLDVTLNYDSPIYSFEVELSQNYPNPFKSTTSIMIFSPKGTDLSVAVFDILGQKVKTLYKGVSIAEVMDVSWDGTNNFGSKVSSGIYICGAVSNGNLISKKMMYLK